MEPRPDAATMETLVDQIVAWADGGPKLRERLASELEKTR
jgi:hypothetical protein